MIPRLFPNNAKPVTRQSGTGYTWYSGGFQTLGYGSVPDAIEGYVDEERNGAFTLSMTVPAETAYINKLNIGTLIVADASPQQKAQAFEIAKVTKTLNGRVQVYAEHITYRLLYSILKPFPSGGIAGLNNVFNRLSTNKNTDYYIEGNDFKFTWSGWPSAANRMTLDEFCSVKQLLQGREGSAVDTYGGCLKYDNFTVTLYYERGTDNGVKILYGKNLTDASAEYNNQTESTASTILPYYKKDDRYITGTLIELQNGTTSLYAYKRAICKDFSSELSNLAQDATDADITEKLNTKARAWANAHLRGVPDVNLKTSFIPLHQTVEYADLANIESVEIDDTVHMHIPTLDIDVDAKVIKTRYNFLQDRYDSVEVGNFRTSINQAIRSVKGAY